MAETTSSMSASLFWPLNKEECQQIISDLAYQNVQWSDSPTDLPEHYILASCNPLSVYDLIESFNGDFIHMTTFQEFPSVAYLDLDSLRQQFQYVLMNMLSHIATSAPPKKILPHIASKIVTPLGDLTAQLKQFTLIFHEDYLFHLSFLIEKTNEIDMESQILWFIQTIPCLFLMRQSPKALRTFVGPHALSTAVTYLLNPYSNISTTPSVSIKNIAEKPGLKIDTTALEELISLNQSPISNLPPNVVGRLINRIVPTTNWIDHNLLTPGNSILCLPSDSEECVPLSTIPQMSDLIISESPIDLHISNRSISHICSAIPDLDNLKASIIKQLLQTDNLKKLTISKLYFICTSVNSRLEHHFL